MGPGVAVLPAPVEAGLAPQGGGRGRAESNLLGDDRALVPGGNPLKGSSLVEGKKKGKLRQAILTCDAQLFWECQDKGTISNFITFIIMIVGVVGVQVYNSNNDDQSLLWLSIQAIGLFGFSGGITNWLAVKMLFDRVPGLYGSGIITQQFKEIRQTVMDTVLETFFDTDFLGNYAKDKAVELEDSQFLVTKLREILECEEADKILERNIAAMFTRPEGMMLMMAGFSAETLKPMVRPFMVDMDKEIAPMLTSSFDPRTMINASAMRDQVKELMATKLEMLTAPMVKDLVEEMIRTHLGWLIVWGNLLGGLIGLVCQLASSAA